MKTSTLYTRKLYSLLFLQCTSSVFLACIIPPHIEQALLTLYNCSRIIHGVISFLKKIDSVFSYFCQNTKT